MSIVLSSSSAAAARRFRSSDNPSRKRSSAWLVITAGGGAIAITADEGRAPDSPACKGRRSEQRSQEPTCFAARCVGERSDAENVGGREERGMGWVGESRAAWGAGGRVESHGVCLADGGAQ